MAGLDRGWKSRRPVDGEAVLMDSGGPLDDEVVFVGLWMKVW